MVSQEKREVGGWWMWIVLLLVVSMVIFGGLRYAGILGQTVAERVIFEQSYQKKSADSAQKRTWRANLAEIEATLLSLDADDPRRPGLEAQRSALRVQLNSME